MIFRGKNCRQQTTTHHYQYRLNYRTGTFKNNLGIGYSAITSIVL